MITDMGTVIWKEWKSLFRQPGSRTRMAITVVVPIGYFGIIGPLQAGAEFSTGAEPWFIAVVLPLLTVIMTAPDSFAGERERKTLRTLLASRLSDSAILWAKIGFAVLLGMAMMVVTLVLATTVATLSGQTDGVALIAAGRLVNMFGVALLLAATAAGAAVLISLRAQTVQQAQQTLAAVFFVVPSVLGPLLFISYGDGGSGPVVAFFDWLGTTAGRVVVVVVLAVMAVSLLASARLAFRRTRLVS